MLMRTANSSRNNKNPFPRNKDSTSGGGHNQCGMPNLCEFTFYRQV
jgi:hypothetical protein